MKKDSILVIANASTRYTAPRGIQANRLINALSESYNVVLITSSRSLPFVEKGDEFSKNVKIYIEDGTPRKLHRAASYLSKFLGTMDFLYEKRAKNRAIKILDTTSIRIIISLSIKFSNSVVGGYLNRKYKIPHITFFSDPISFNPYFYSKYRIVNSLIRRLENHIIQSSSSIVVPSSIMLEEYKTRYSTHEKKFELIPHSFQTNQISILERPKENRLKVIRYIGSLNTKRTPVPLLREIKDYQSIFLEKGITFEFIGPKQRKLQKELQGYQSKVVSFLGKIPYEDVENKINSSYALLVLDHDIQNSPFLPSKLIEMLPYRIPIVGITGEDSETRRVLEKTGHIATTYSKLDLSDILQRIELFESDMDYSEYSISNIANKWNLLINRYL